MNKTVSDAATGLTSDEARRRLAANGVNAVQDVVQHPITRALNKLWAPVPWMLEAAILLQLALDDYVEASAVALLRSRRKQRHSRSRKSILVGRSTILAFHHLSRI